MTTDWGVVLRDVLACAAAHSIQPSSVCDRKYKKCPPPSIDMHSSSSLVSSLSLSPPCNTPSDTCWDGSHEAVTQQSQPTRATRRRNNSSSTTRQERREQNWISSVVLVQISRVTGSRKRPSSIRFDFYIPTPFFSSRAVTTNKNADGLVCPPNHSHPTPTPTHAAGKKNRVALLAVIWQTTTAVLPYPPCAVPTLGRYHFYVVRPPPQPLITQKFTSTGKTRHALGGSLQRVPRPPFYIFSVQSHSSKNKRPGGEINSTFRCPSSENGPKKSHKNRIKNTPKFNLQCFAALPSKEAAAGRCGRDARRYFF